MRECGKKLKPHLLYLLLIFGLVALDQWTKVLAEENLSMHRVITVIPNFFDFSLSYNPGAAFGIGRNWSEWWRKFFFLGVSTVAALLIVHLAYRHRQDSWLPRLGLALILSGAIGNLIDRYRFGLVVDFIHVFYKNYHWPNFNIADSCICVGITLYAIYLLKAPRVPHTT